MVILQNASPTFYHFNLWKFPQLFDLFLVLEASFISETFFLLSLVFAPELIMLLA